MVDNSLQNNNYGLGLYSNNSLQNSTQTAGKTTSGEKELEQAKDNKVKDNEAVSLSKNVEKAVDTKSISKSNEFENFQNKINSFTTDNKTIKDIKKETKLLILSNGSTIADPLIQNTLSKLDIVKLSLDCVSPKCFKKLDRAHIRPFGEKTDKSFTSFCQLAGISQKNRRQSVCDSRYKKR